MSDTLQFLAALAMKAGSAILEIYQGDFTVERKSDQSPLTEADTRSHEIIARGLEDEFPGIPILSEEGKNVPFDERRRWSRFWLVDPLDGTKEFVKRNGEFTVNIALIEGRQPTLGVIHVPALEFLYVADIRAGCWEESSGGRRPLHVQPPGGASIRVVMSRSHPAPGLEDLLAGLPGHVAVARGSALKFCAVAAGEADFYPRLGPTWEWDTAAGQAIVTAAGGVVVDAAGKPLEYNKEDLLNGPFFVAHSRGWLERQRVLG
jgi:3'(2'), 5'-bisphosphate nucleotidase